MTELTIDFPDDVIDPYYARLYKETPRLTSCKEIEARVSALIVKDLETLRKRNEARKDKRIFKDNKYERF